ncbi:cell surface glycoprotein MUC18 isoform 2-T2 [Synchiropus picturatus]
MLRLTLFLIVSVVPSLRTSSGTNNTSLITSAESLLFFRTKVEVLAPDNVEVFLGDTAEIPCRYNFTEEDPTFVMVQWFVKAEGSTSRVRIFYGDNNINVVDSDTDYSNNMQVIIESHGTVLSISDVRLLDDRVFYCQVNGVAAGMDERKTHLRVFATPEPPVIEGVQTGISVTNELPSKVASCEVRNGFPKPNITWYRNGVPLVPSPGYVNVLTLVTRSELFSVQSTLEYKVQKEDKDSHFSCEVTFAVPAAIRTVESSSIKITVHYPTTMAEMWKELPKGLVKEGDAVELRCQSDGNPPPPFLFNREQEPSRRLDSSGGDVLILTEVTRKDSGIYQCHPQDPDAPHKVKGEMQLTVHYLDPAVVVPKDSEFMFRGENLTATCNALSSLKTSTVWYKEGRRVGEGHSLHLYDATYQTSGEYRCEVTVPSVPSLHTSGSVHIVVQGAPQLVGLEKEVHLKEAEGRMVNLTCEALGHPTPTVFWNIRGSENWQELVSKASDHMVHSMVSVKVSADIVATCNVSNDMGLELKSFHVKAVPSSAPFSTGEGNGVILLVIIPCLLLLGIFGSVIYFLHKTGRFPCGRSGKQEITKEKTTKDDIVVEMKSDGKAEDAVPLKAVNGEKKSANGNHDNQATRRTDQPI